DPGNSLFLITDGSAKQSELRSSVVAAANAKTIHIFIFLFDSACDADDGYSALAASTLGQFFPLARQEAALITEQVDFWLQSELTPIASFTNVPTDTAFV